MKTKKIESGFTLLEVVAAFAVFALALGAIYSLYGTSVQRIEKSNSRAMALAIAQSQLAESLARSDFKNSEGDVANYHWQVVYSDLSESKKKAGKWHLFSVETKVVWQGAGKENELMLETQRLGFVDNHN